jgi:hypothetical protein
MKTNFMIWCIHYELELNRWYTQFIKEFKSDSFNPTYQDFCNYVYLNTEKYKKNGKLVAPLI